MAVKPSWHGGSRIYRWGVPMVFSTHLLSIATMFLVPESLGEAYVMVGAVTTAFIAGAKAVNYQERKNGNH